MVLKASVSHLWTQWEKSPILTDSNWDSIEKSRMCFGNRTQNYFCFSIGKQQLLKWLPHIASSPRSKTGQPWAGWLLQMPDLLNFTNNSLISFQIPESDRRSLISLRGLHSCLYNSFLNFSGIGWDGTVLLASKHSSLTSINESSCRFIFTKTESRLVRIVLRM